MMSNDSPLEAMRRVFMRVSIPDLLSLARHSPEVHDIVRQELRTRHIRYITPFCGKTDNMLQMMRSTGAVISGPFALRYLEGNANWSVNDMDMYAPHDTHGQVVDYFKKEGYAEYETVDPTKPTNSKDKWMLRRKATRKGVKSVTHLSNSTCRVDVVQVMSPDPTYAIIHFWTTIHMNYLSADGFCSLYPSLTFKKVGVVAPIFLNGVAAPRACVLRVLQRWQMRGYRFVSRYDNSDGRMPLGDRSPIVCDPSFDDGEPCSRPATAQGTEDEYCFTFSYGDEEHSYEEGVSLIGGKEWRVGWNLGGPWDGRFYPAKAYTFSSHTGHRVDIYTYLYNSDSAQFADIDEVD